MGDLAAVDRPGAAVGAIAERGDVMFWRDVAAVGDKRRKLWRVGIVTEVTWSGRVYRWVEINYESLGEHTDIGIRDVVLLESTNAGIDFPRAVEALRKRSARGFASLDTARKFLMRFAK